MIKEIIEEEVRKFVSDLPTEDREKAEVCFREGMITAYTVVFNNLVRQGININILQDGL